MSNGKIAFRVFKHIPSFNLRINNRGLGVKAKVVKEVLKFKKAEPLINNEIEFWTGYAPVIHILRETRDYRNMLRLTSSLLDIQPGEVVLDAGCGVGNWIIDNLQKGADIFGVDLTPKMLQEANQEIEKAKEDRHPQQINRLEEQKRRFILGDLNEGLAFKSESFHKIASIFLYGYLFTRKKALQDFYRCLKPGGKIVITTPIKGTYFIGTFLRGVWESMTDRERGFMYTLMHLPIGLEALLYGIGMALKARGGIYHFFTEEELAKELEEKGFKNVCTAITFGGRGICASGIKPSYNI